MGRIPLASCRTWGLFKHPSRPDAHAHNHPTDTHIHCHSLTHTHTTPLINPQITQPIITTLVLIRNYLKHFPIRVYMLSWAGVCLHKPTGFMARGETASSCVCSHTHTHEFLDLTVVIRQSGRVSLLGRGGRGQKKKEEREKEIKQQSRAPSARQQYCRSLLLGPGTVISRGHNETCQETHAN